MMSFLMALLFLSIYLNNHYDPASGWPFLLGVIGFGAVGVLFLARNSTLTRTIDTSWDHQNSEVEDTSMDDKDESVEEDEDANETRLSLFELLVEEALGSIPDEFHEQMENVLVRVQSEPGQEVLKHVGIKEGYTLVGLYESTPLTADAHNRFAHPE